MLAPGVLVACFAFVGKAKADCDATGRGAPILGIVSASTNSASVPWFKAPGCTVSPQAIEVPAVKQTGTIIGEQNKLNWAINGGTVPITGLTAGSPSGNLFLCAD